MVPFAYGAAFSSSFQVLIENFPKGTGRTRGGAVTSISTMLKNKLWEHFLPFCCVNRVRKKLFDYSEDIYLMAIAIK